MADPALRLSSDGSFRAITSSNGQSKAWPAYPSSGWATTIPAPADFDGDGDLDPTVWQPSNGTWYITRSSDGSQYTQVHGQNGDTPVPADYDGDGVDDIAIWRGSTGLWSIRSSETGGTITHTLGSSAAPNYDIPVPYNYDGTDGDGRNRADPAVWRRKTSAPAEDGYWYVLRSNSAYGLWSAAWGASAAPFNDLPVPGDYDGDGKGDLAVWRRKTSAPADDGNWYVLKSSTNYLSSDSTVWGISAAPYNDVPTQGDYDADGKTDHAVWRKSDGNWYIRKSSNGQSQVVAMTITEQCDDSNTNNGDGCSSICQNEAATDTTPPSCSATNASTSWRTSWPTVVVAASDNVGIASLKYYWGAPVTPTTGFTTTAGFDLSIAPPPDGNNTLYLECRDAAGNTATWSGTYRVDSSAPLIQGVTVNVVGQTANSITVSANWTFSDPQSGIANNAYCLSTNGTTCLPTPTPSAAPSPSPPPSPSPSPSPAPTGSISASPNPIQVCDGTGLGITTLTWTSSVNADVLIGSPTGTLFASTGIGTFNQATGKWVSNGTTFYLVQKLAGGGYGATLANVSVATTTVGCPSPSPSPSPSPTPPGTPLTSGVGASFNLSSGSWGHYYFNVTGNPYRLTVTTTGPNIGNANLYVRKVGQPTTTTWDYRSNTAASNNETINIYDTSAPALTTGIWYIGVYAASGSPQGTLTATLTPCSATTGQSCDDGNACTGNGIRQCSGVCSGATVISGTHRACDGMGSCITVPHSSSECTHQCDFDWDCSTGFVPNLREVAQSFVSQAVPRTQAQSAGMTQTGATGSFSSVTYPYTSGVLYVLVQAQNGAGTWSTVSSAVVPGTSGNAPLLKPASLPDSGEYYSPISLTLDATGTNAANLFTTTPGSAPVAIYLIPQAGFDNPFTSQAQVVAAANAGWGTCPSQVTGGCKIIPGNSYALSLPSSGTNKDASWALLADFGSGSYSWMTRRYRTTILDPAVENVRFNAANGKLEVAVRNAGKTGQVTLFSSQGTTVDTLSYTASNVSGSGLGLSVVSVTPTINATVQQQVRYVRATRNDVSPVKTSALFAYRFPESTAIANNAFSISPAKVSVQPEETVSLLAKLPGTNTAQAQLTWTVKLPVGATGYSANDLTADTFPAGAGNQRVSFKVKDAATSKGKTFIIEASIVGNATVPAAQAEIRVVDTTATDLSRYMFTERLPGTSIVYLGTDNAQLESNQSPPLLLTPETVTALRPVIQGTNVPAGTVLTIGGTTVADNANRTFTVTDGSTLDIANSTACGGVPCRGLRYPYVVTSGLPAGATRVLLAMANDDASTLSGSVTISSDINLPRALTKLTYVFTDSCFQIGIVLRNAQDVPEAVVTGTCPVGSKTGTTGSGQCYGGTDTGPIGIFDGEQCTSKLQKYLGLP